MRKITKLILLTLTLCMLFIATQSRLQAMGCGCGPTPLNDEMYGRMKMIIAGEITETRKERFFHPKVENLSLKIKVDRVWKEKTERIIWLPLLNQVSDCPGMEIVLGRKYLFRVSKNGSGAVVLGVCGASGFLEGATDDLKYLSTKASWTYSEK